MISTDKEAQDAAEKLRALQALAKNPMWVEFVAKVKEARKRHGDGVRARDKTAEQRSEHVEASFLADELDEWHAKQTDAIMSALREYQKRTSEMSMAVLDAMNVR